MQRLITTLSVLLLFAVGLSAQDIITKKDGSEIEAKVVEVDEHVVKYLLFAEPEGPLYTISKEDLLLIHYASGRSEVFGQREIPYYDYNPRSAVQGLRPGMKYNELKNLYDTALYSSMPGDPHNPALMGVCSWLVPGLGQMLCGESERGLYFLAGSLGCGVGAFAGMLITSAGATAEDSVATLVGGTLFLLCPLAMAGVDIWSIVDAVKVAKVKDMYQQDLRRQNNFSLDLRPSLNAVQNAGGIRYAPGMTLALTF